MEYISYRMDAYTRVRYPQNQMLRFVIIDSNIILDVNKTMKGRGFYLLKDNVKPYFEKGAGKRYLKGLSADFFQRVEDVK